MVPAPMVMRPAAVSTTLAKKGQVAQKWYLIDAADQVVGRLAVQIATILRGKHRPDYTPHVDTGDFVVVVNAEKVRFTGKKWDSKTYAAYSHYPGGLKVVGARDVLAKHPERSLTEAVRRMVPRPKPGKTKMPKPKVYAGNSHPHQAQQPVAYKPV